MTCTGATFLYRLGNKICTYSLENNTISEVLEVPHLVGAAIWDGRLIYWDNPRGTTDEELITHIYNLSTKETISVGNNGNTGAVAFAIHNETKDAFVGLYEGANGWKGAWIYKEDFYAGRYERATFFAR